jgi:hypothetical protein
MKTEQMPEGVRVTKVKWHEIATEGMPPKEIRLYANGVDRTFLVRGEWSIYTAYVYSDGSGFDTPEHNSDTAIAWAVIDGF